MTLRLYLTTRTKCNVILYTECCVLRYISFTSVINLLYTDYNINYNHCKVITKIHPRLIEVMELFLLLVRNLSFRA